jgi:hypothetical protein
MHFSRQFNCQRPRSEDLEQGLQKSGALQPIQTEGIQSVTWGSIGTASFSSIDTKNLRSKLSSWMLGDVPATLGINIVLMMLHFGLVMMPCNKIYAYIYEDNPQALHNAFRFEFVPEGKLQDDFHIAGHGFVSVNHGGLAQVHGNAELKSLAKLKFGQTW